jgi:DNA-binding CsgD family transcriptional regulator
MLHLPAEHLLVDLAPALRDALAVLAVVEPVPIEAALRLVGEDKLRELDSASLVRAVPVPTGTLVVVYPPLVAEHLRRLSSALRAALAGDAAAPAWRRTGDDAFPAVLRADAAVYGRALEARQAARLALASDAWVAAPDAESGAAYLRASLARGGDAEVTSVVIAQLARVTDHAQVDLRVALSIAALSRHRAERARAVLQDGADSAAGSERDLLALAGIHLVTGTERNPGLDLVDPLLRSTDPVVRDTAHVTAAEIHLVGGRPDLALRALDAVVTETRELSVRAGVVRGLALVLTGRSAEALRWSTTAYEQARADFDAEAIHAHGYVLALQLGALARFDDVRDHLGAVLTGDLPATTWPFAAGNLSIAGHVSLLERRTVRAASLAAQARSISPRGPLPGMTTPWAELLETDDPAEASRLVWEHVEHDFDVGWVMAATIAAPLAAMAHPDPGRADWFADRLERTGAVPLLPYARVVQVLSGSSPEAAASAAHELLEGDHLLLALLATRRALRLLRASDRHGEALDVVDAMRAEFARTGSQIDPLIESVGPVGSLTARERQIAEMASTGATNAMLAERLHLSVRTVENHLRRVYAKLGVKDREGASRALASWPSGPGSTGKGLR